MFYRHVLFLFFRYHGCNFFSSISFEKVTANYLSRLPLRTFSQRKNYARLFVRREAIDELTLRKIIAMQKEEFRVRGKNMQHGLRHEIFEPSITVVDFVVLPRNRGI